jgi:hypothetical protein
VCNYERKKERECVRKKVKLRIGENVRARKGGWPFKTKMND